MLSLNHVCKIWQKPENEMTENALSTERLTVGCLMVVLELYTPSLCQLIESNQFLLQSILEFELFEFDLFIL